MGQLVSLGFSARHAGISKAIGMVVKGDEVEALQKGRKKIL